MTNAVLKAIADRRSNRGYAPRQLTEEELDAIMLAAVQAPSAESRISCGEGPLSPPPRAAGTSLSHWWLSSPRVTR